MLFQMSVISWVFLLLMKKTVGPCKKIEFLGLTIDTDEMLVKIPGDKIQKLIC